MLGISIDSSATQNAFSVAMGNVTYPILSDFYPHGKVAQLYGIFNEEKGTSFRAVIVIDRKGIIRFKRIYTSAADIKVDDILADVETISRSETC